MPEPRAARRAAVLAACIAVLGTPIGALAAAPAIPAEGLAVIQKVHEASSRKDVSALRALMTEEFTWSFGGDRDREQAIEHWKAHPGSLAQLAKVTGMPCASEQGVVECPRKAGTGYRAGFQQTADGWRMFYFVAGD